jgi:hypothetical protein
MESIQSTSTPSVITRQTLGAPMRRFQLIFQPPHLRAPVLEEMQEDLTRLIAKVARQYNDASCPELNYDELEAEGRAKLAYIISEKGNAYTKSPTRVKFFQFFATALNNHVRSLVHKYRFTEKRTGVKPPPKEDRFNPNAATLSGEVRVKTVEVRLDDEEVNLQVADKPCDSAREHESTELKEDYESCLNEIERMVFRQLTEPNRQALDYATLDARRGHVDGTPLKLKIKSEHLAAGLCGEDRDEFPVELFDKIVLRIREKITKHRSMTQAEETAKFKRNAALAQLEQVFNLQIPKTTDPVVVSRLLTIAARDQFDKVKDSPQVQELLALVGAKIPKSLGGVLACRGVLYSKNNRICNSCGYRNPCAVEAANVGLGKITLSPRLLGAKNTRIPAILPGLEGEAEAPVPTGDEMEIVAYLDENFGKTSNKGKSFYVHKERFDNNSAKLLFQVITDGADFKLRFCNPSESLKRKLRYESKCYFAPPGLSVSEMIALIDTHAKETYAVS